MKSIKTRGESSHLNESRPCIVHSPSPKKPHGKNKFVKDFPMPKIDKYKLLDLASHMGKFGKKWDEDEKEKKEQEKAEKEKVEREKKDVEEGKPVKPKLFVGKLAHDSLWRSEFAFITRNDQIICVPPGHLLYSKAKKDEEERLKGSIIVDDAQFQRFIEQFQAELDDELRDELGEESNLALQQQILDEAKKNLKF